MPSKFFLTFLIGLFSISLHATSPSCGTTLFSTTSQNYTLTTGQCAPTDHNQVIIRSDVATIIATFTGGCEYDPAILRNTQLYDKNNTLIGYTLRYNSASTTGTVTDIFDCNNAQFATIEERTITVTVGNNTIPVSHTISDPQTSQILGYIQNLGPTSLHLLDLDGNVIGQAQTVQPQFACATSQWVLSQSPTTLDSRILPFIVALQQLQTMPLPPCGQQLLAQAYTGTTIAIAAAVILPVLTVITYFGLAWWQSCILRKKDPSRHFPMFDAFHHPCDWECPCSGGNV